MKTVFDNSSVDATLDAPRARKDLSLPTIPVKASRERCAQVCVVEGSGPHLSGETASVLRVRLRAAAICLFAGFGVFFLWRLLSGGRGASSISEWVFWLHLLTTAALALPAVLLCRKCEKQTLPWLRMYELLTFGTPAVFFVVLNVLTNLHWAKVGALANPMAMWLLLIFTYALFIPNSWKRAALVLTPMALAPVVIAGWMYFSSPVFAQALSQSGGYLVEIVLQALLCLVVAVFGVHTIGTLRQEAFQFKQLGQYRLLRLIGAGGMGEVYLAEHQMMKRPCAIKLIHPGKSTDPRALARFEREVRAMAKLSHWNTVEIFDYGRTENGTFYYVMEYLPGLNLGELVDRHGPMAPARAVYLLRQVCDALEEAHSHGLIHRDLKPGNIFSAKRGGVYDVGKLLDFGLAKNAVEANDVDLTQEGSITGSPLFMSPEQAMGDSEPDARGDVYSLGAVLYFLLTGQAPFPGDKPMKVILAHVNQEAEPPSLLRPEIPADLDRIVMRCLAKDINERYQSIAELRQALDECSVAGGWNREEARLWWQNHDVCQQAEDLLASA